MSKSSPTVTSPIAAILNAFSLTSSAKSEQPQDFDAGINASSAWTQAGSPEPRASVSSFQGLDLDLGALGSLAEEGPSDGDDEGGSEGHEQELILSDSEGGGEDSSDGIDSIKGKPARALYAFKGKVEFRELMDVRAGDLLEVLKDEVGDGWSLVRHLRVESRRKGKGLEESNSVEGGEVEGELNTVPEDEEEEQRGDEVGLLPRSYYTVCLFSRRYAITFDSQAT